MSWSHRSAARLERFATDREVQSTFEAESENLAWIALVITGDPLLVHKATVDASGLQKSTTGVFFDWVSHWAHAATARASASLVRPSIVRSAREYQLLDCDHREHEPLQPAEILEVRRLEPLEIIDGLDPLARTTLVLRGIQQASISDCSLFLRLPRQAVAKAYCHVLTWLEQHGAMSGKSDPMAICNCRGRTI